MTTYTNILNSDIDQDSPVTQPLMTALRDNPIAITEGASGAPKIANAAHVAPEAGGTVVCRLQIAEVQTDGTSYPDSGSSNHFDPGQHIGCTILVSGTIRVYFEHLGINASARVLKDGSIIEEWSVSSAEFVTRTVDVAVEVGDQISIQQKAFNPSAPATWRRLRIQSSNLNFVAA